ncbi:podocalyxin-like [Procambarus clarkii]|uniref:podocalyxin-like n=1 Tax=Procambarus clarkii TaxID=6728 RepID=UPI003742EF3D
MHAVNNVKQQGVLSIIRHAGGQDEREGASSHGAGQWAVHWEPPRLPDRAPVPTTGRCTCRDPPRRASFFSTSTRPRPAPAPSPPTTVGATTPHCGEPSAEEITGGNSFAQTLSAGTWTSATTIGVEHEAPGTTTSSPEDPPASKSSTSAQAVEECRERFGSGRTSLEPEADPEPWVSRRANRRPLKNGSSLNHRWNRAAHIRMLRSPPPPPPSTQHLRDNWRGPVAGDEEDENVGDLQRPSGRLTGAAGTATGAGRSANGTVTSGGGAGSSGVPPGDVGGAASANGTSTPSPTESTPTGSGGKSSSQNRFTGATAAPDHPAA